MVIASLEENESRPALSARVERTLPTRGISYRIEGSGPLLVNICGLDGTGQLLFKQIGALARSYRVVTFRLRDHGKFDYTDLTNDIAAIIEDLGERCAVIMGESFGGTVALSFALQHPEKVARLIVINSFPRFRQRARIRLAAWFAETLPFPAIFPARLLSTALGMFLDGVSVSDRKRFYEAVRTVEGDGYARRLRLISEFDVEARLAEIKAPTLFIAAEKDLLIPSVKEARLMAARMPNATVKTIPGAGHACLMGNRVCLADLLE